MHSTLLVLEIGHKGDKWTAIIELDFSELSAIETLESPSMNGKNNSLSAPTAVKAIIGCATSIVCGFSGTVGELVPLLSH